MKKTIALLFLACLTFGFVNAQTESEAAYVRVGLGHAGALSVGDAASLQISVVPKSGWHVYSALPSEEGAYMPAAVAYDESSRGFEADPELGEEGKMVSQYDDIMGGVVRYYEGKVLFSQSIKVTERDVIVIGTLDYMACNEFKCIPLMAEFKVTATAEQ